MLPFVTRFSNCGCSLSDGVRNLNSSDPFAILGVAAMFLMIGLGVYEVTAAPGEKKPLNELLKDE